jgi:hypothetical protein
MNDTLDEVGLQERRGIDAPMVASLDDRVIVPATPVEISW